MCISFHIQGCANLSGAPPPTPGIISRGLGSEGIGVLLAGLVGTSNATTSYSENIGALAVTGVGSRAVIQCGAVTMVRHSDLQTGHWTLNL